MGRTSTMTLVLAFLFGSCLLAAPAAASQEIAAGTTGVSVIGYGEASAPAESATLLLSLNEANYGGPPSPEPGATPGTEEREKTAPVVASLVDAGVSEDDIEVITGPSIANSGSFSGPTTAVLRIALDDAPTLDWINGLIDAAGVGAADESLLVGGVVALYEVDDCDALDREAREAAIEDARARADVQAELLGVTLGDITGSSDLPSGFYGPATESSGCAPLSTFGSPFDFFSYRSFDPTAEPVVEIYAQVQLTFAIG